MAEETIDGTPDNSGGSEQHKRARRKKHFNWLKSHRAQLITTAKRSAEEDLHHRERVYAWIQGSRIPLIILALATYWWLQNIWLSGFLFIVSIPLPWLAVLFANLHGEPRDRRAPKVYKPALAREQEQWQVQQAQRDQLEAPEANPSTIVIDHED